MQVVAVLGLGSNLGERLGNLQRAVDLLGSEEGIRVTASSSVWETDPVGPSQPDFLNSVVSIETTLSPLGLLEACQRAEAALSRVRAEHWGPRTLDVDIILIDDLVLDEPSLTVPHPLLLERAFVLVPLLELDPDAKLPDGRLIREAGAAIDLSRGVRPFAPPLAVGA
jgi:2-amino-4-hydroxy-6-hydroxymethyldihydropteridine diphosphokinase